MDDHDEGIRAPTSAPEGGSFEVEVRDGAGEVEVFIGNERTSTRIVVRNGRATVPIPSRASAGTLITVMTRRTPPSAAVVEVVGSEE